MIRRQLSLFIDDSAGRQIERLRHVLDPVQGALIPAHVTLARDDEVEMADIRILKSRAIIARSISLTFVVAETFAGHGVLLRTAPGQVEFEALRRHILGSDSVAQSTPHITLAHPRNPRAPGNNGAPVDLDLPLTFDFDRVMLIEQRDPHGRWEIIGEFPFAEPSRPNLESSVKRSRHRTLNEQARGE